MPDKLVITNNCIFAIYVGEWGRELSQELGFPYFDLFEAQILPSITSGCYFRVLSKELQVSKHTRPPIPSPSEWCYYSPTRHSVLHCLYVSFLSPPICYMVTRILYHNRRHHHHVRANRRGVLHNSGGCSRLTVRG